MLTYDPIGEGERNLNRKSGTREHDHIVNRPHTGPRLGGLMVTDAMQAVSYLLNRPDVDLQRIAVAGCWSRRCCFELVILNLHW